MSARSRSLSTRIAREIAACGAMGFARFMELALYDPVDGYYASGHASVGRSGDFFTNVSVGPVFGFLLAGQFLEMWEVLGRPEEFTLVEQGANDGQLACDILSGLAGSPLESVPLVIIEPFEPLRNAQSALLEGRNVRWVESPEELPDFCGVHFSNELFDALPFRLMRAVNGDWHEVLVDSNEEGFFFRPSALPLHGTGLPVRPDGFRTEVRVGQLQLLEALAARLQAGFILAIDYGHSREELLAPQRSDGTLACYSSHRRDAEALENPGGKDITAHVDFSALAGDAVACGLELQGYADQHHFLVGAATGLLRSLDGLPPTPSSLRTLRSLRTLLHPETMGTQFKAMLLAKGIHAAARPSGFAHGRDAAGELGLGV